MPNTHRRVWSPFGDLHAIDEFERTNLRVAKERGADTTIPSALETDRDRIVHPRDVIFDRLDGLPHLRRWCRNIDGYAEP